MNPEQKKRISRAITGTFMWDFKDGDNIVYNFEIVCELYKAKSNEQSLQLKSLYNKPIMLLLIAIIECILDDFNTRVSHHVRDKVPNITPKQIEDYKTKKRDKLEHHISAARKHNLFDANDDFYLEMSFLREVRNRFHIQNTGRVLENDEDRVFTDKNLHRVEIVFGQVLKTMMTKFYRGPDVDIRFEEVELPWNSSDNSHV